MNEYQKELMDAPSVKSDRCVFCGRPAHAQHHVVPRSQGGSKGPTLSVCGFGNESGCHGLLHAHKLHPTYSDLLGWEYIYTQESMKYEEALEIKDGWHPIRGSYDL